MSARDRDWPTRCTLMGCKKPDQRPHHHHPGVAGHTSTHPCQCKDIDERGTRPRVDPDGRPIR